MTSSNEMGNSGASATAKFLKKDTLPSRWIHGPLMPRPYRVKL